MRICCIMAINLSFFGVLAYEKSVPSNLAIRFKNASDQKVHALFIYTPEFSNVFKAGGWTKKAFNSLEKLSLKCVALFPEETTKKTDSKTSDSTKKTTTIPKKDVVEPWLKASLDSLDTVLKLVMQPDVIVSTISKKDYFKQVFPGLIVDSHRNPRSGQRSTNLRRYTNSGDITLAIYPDDSAYNLPDFGAPLYIGNFNHGKYNSVVYGPVNGHVTYQYIDPKTKKVVRSKDKLFVPVEVDSEGKLEIQEIGQEAARDLIEKEREEGKIIFE